MSWADFVERANYVLARRWPDAQLGRIEHYGAAFGKPVKFRFDGSSWVRWYA